MREFERPMIPSKTELRDENSEPTEPLSIEDVELLEHKLEGEVSWVYERMTEHPLVAEALMLLDKLPAHLRYHAKQHTLDVVRETILFTVADDLSLENPEHKKIIERQVIAAAWHDVGYIEKDSENEIIAIDMLRESKNFQELPETDQREILETIKDTELIMKEGAPHLLKQHSTDGYMLDGDVSNFGRKDFFEKRMLVAEELNLDLDNLAIRKKFYLFAVNLLKNHTWKTSSAYRLREVQRIKNLKQAEKELSELIN